MFTHTTVPLTEEVISLIAKEIQKNIEQKLKEDLENSKKVDLSNIPHYMIENMKYGSQTFILKHINRIQELMIQLEKIPYSTSNFANKTVDELKIEMDKLNEHFNLFMECHNNLLTNKEEF